MADNSMTGNEAIRIARRTLAAHYDLEVIQVKGCGIMVPKERDWTGAAVNPEAQEAADAYNWLAKNHAHLGGHR